MIDDAKIIRIGERAGGAAPGMVSPLLNGRYEIVSAGFDPNLQLVGSDPYGTSTYTGITVPVTALGPGGIGRYLCHLARAQFGAGEAGARLVGIRMYASLIAIIPGTNGAPPTIFERQITSPLWRPSSGNISWHVMVLPKTRRDTRNPLNADSVAFEDSVGPALLIRLADQSPPNGGRPWGTPINSSLGNMHDLRYPWTDNLNELSLDVPVPVPSDIAIFASVKQINASLNPTVTLSARQFDALGPEDKFLVAYPQALYGRVAASLIFDKNFSGGSKK